MTLYYSTGLRDFVAAYGPYKRALQGGTMCLYSGSVPASADAALTSGYVLLNKVTLASGAHTNEVRAAGSATLAGTAGTVTALTVDGKEILGGTVTFVDTLTNLAVAVAAQINAYCPLVGAEYIATSSGAKVIITCLPGTGIVTGAVVTTGSGGITSTDVAVGTEVTGIASANGLTYGGSTSGVLAKGSGVWSGTNLATGTASYFRLYGSVADTLALSTTLVRIQGTCGTSGSDYIMSSTTLTLSYTHTVDGFTLTLPAS